MARRGGRQRRDIYEGLPTDAEYKRTAHKRAKSQSLKRWLVRFLFLAVIALLVWQFGDDVKRLLRVEAHQVADEMEGVGDHIKEGRDRRAGVDWVEGE
ncbi:MAG: hypothetical protein JXA57_00475 [Armatimonadetes bacterium]|nr:hypothetical protein [Armatimonadota bacterium]